MYGDRLKIPAAKNNFKLKWEINSICQQLEETTCKTKVLRLCSLASTQRKHAEVKFNLASLRRRAAPQIG